MARKISYIPGGIRIDITDTNNLINAILIAGKSGLKSKGKCQHNLKEQWQKRRITQPINETKKTHADILARK